VPFHPRPAASDSDADHWQLEAVLQGVVLVQRQRRHFLVLPFPLALLYWACGTAVWVVTSFTVSCDYYHRAYGTLERSLEVYEALSVGLSGFWPDGCIVFSLIPQHTFELRR
jgi:hypothetical protein